MSSISSPKTKSELQIYLLLLCAYSDNYASQEELEFIQQKVDPTSYKRISEEFLNDSEEERIDKIEDAVRYLEYSYNELSALRREMYEVFFSDCEFKMMERNLDRLLDNILY